jgi:L-malate glycosyltransferase
MRIAFVSLMGGSVWAASEVLWALTAQLGLHEGHSVFVSTFDWGSEPEAISRLRANGALVDLRSRARWIRRSTIASRFAKSFLRLEQFEPDVVCVNQGGTYDIARGGATAVLRDSLRRLNVPCVLLCHCEQPMPRKGHTRIARAFFERAAIVGLLGARLKRVVEVHLGTELRNARVFHNPVNLDQIEYSTWPDMKECLRFAFVGRLDPVKNLAVLIDALSEPTWQSRAWRLNVFGSGSQRTDLEALVSRRSMQQRIRFVGHVDDIAEVWREHHVLTLPSRFEGLPLAMIEAMLCGRPVLAVDTGGISEWVRDGETGFLATHSNAIEIGRTLERLWAQRMELERMGRIAHEHTIANRDPDPSGSLLKMLREAANHASARP